MPHSYKLVFEAHELHQLVRYITRKNHSYWSYVHQLSYGTGAPPCVHIALYIYIFIPAMWLDHGTYGHHVEFPGESRTLPNSSNLELVQARLGDASWMRGCPKEHESTSKHGPIGSNWVQRRYVHRDELALHPYFSEHWAIAECFSRALSSMSSPTFGSQGNIWLWQPKHGPSWWVDIFWAINNQYIQLYTHTCTCIYIWIYIYGYI